ncbi:pyridoxamine 5'-phosphate oxidase family protein [Roseburia hominis]
MRRKDREICDIQEILKIVDHCKVCRIGLCDEGKVYIVPVNFGYQFRNEKLVLYMHGAKAGYKYEVMEKNPQVGFEMDCEHELLEAEAACGYGYCFASIIGNGVAELVTDMEEKKEALALLMRQQTGKDFSFGEKEADSVTVWKVTSETFTAKQRK